MISNIVTKFSGRLTPTARFTAQFVLIISAWKDTESLVIKILRQTSIDQEIPIFCFLVILKLAPEAGTLTDYRQVENVFMSSIIIISMVILQSRTTTFWMYLHFRLPHDN